MTINELIKELKITNITHVKLKDVCIFERGKSLEHKNLQGGNIPVISSSYKPMAHTTKFNRSECCITISTTGDGSAGKNILFHKNPI